MTFTIGVLATVGCEASSDPLILRVAAERPAREVIVDTYPWVIALGDTMRVQAYAYDSTGQLTQYAATRRWSISNSAGARLSSTGEPSTALLTATAVGRVTVTATIGGRTGSDTVWVVPTNARPQLLLSATTFHVKDTIAGTVALVDNGGVDVGWRRLMLSNNNGAVVQAELRDTLGNVRIVGRGPGAATITLQVGRWADRVEVTVLP